jgi:hypothetical protein
MQQFEASVDGEKLSRNLGLDKPTLFIDISFLTP